MDKPIGIIGIGDLGSQLATQLLESGRNVLIFDIDSTRTIEDINTRIAISLAEVLEECALVHWCVPSKALPIEDEPVENVTIILHDSVMHNSIEAIQSRSDRHLFAIVHCLMNEQKRIFVAHDAPNSGPIMQHLEDIGLSPKLISTKEHDVLMAHSQGILATFIKMGLRSELDEASRAGDLTPSANELHSVLMNRELNWTPSTLESILANPELIHVAQNIVTSVAE